MKKVFHPHPVLYFCGRPLTLVFVFVSVLWTFMATEIAFFGGGIDYEFIFYLLVALGLDALVIWWIRHFGPLIWSRLVITDNEITWKCLFCKSIRIPYEKIRYAGILALGNINYVHTDLYHTGFRYLIISQNGIPTTRVDKIRCKQGVIKWLASPSVCQILQDKVPRPYQGALRQVVRLSKKLERKSRSNK